MGLFERAKGEFAYLRGALRTLNRVKPIRSTPNRTMCDRMEEIASRHPDRVALISGGETLTYGEYNGRTNRYARFACSEGVVKGEAVALFMQNRPEYLAIWMGVARSGGATALLNTSQTGRALAHSISLVKPKIAIVATEMLEAWQSALPFLDTLPKIFVHGATETDAPRVDDAVMRFSPEALKSHEKVELTLDDNCLYVFTSGTTGLPKVENISHYRVSAIALGFSAVMEVGKDDRLYDCLPMYHSNGGILSTLGVLVQGGSVVIREKFSARDFWPDIVEHGCTLFFYIGELCRHLVNAPSGQLDRAHRIRLVCGNGLRPDIWSTFSERFGIRHIREFYGATEANIALFNFDSRPGAIGRIPKWAEKRVVVKVVRFDVENEKPLRDAMGRCMLCGPDEMGEILGEIADDPAVPAKRTDGHAAKKTDEAKILRNVFREGDAWSRSGDLVTRDEKGYFYFVDRIGDTFRWKGQNVATSEVAETINVHPGVIACAVYGVALAGQDGKAGMAAILPSDGAPLDLDALGEHLARNLPHHARPVFVRIRRQMDMTGTFKLRKVELVREGIEPSTADETIHWLDQESGRYRVLDGDVRRAIAEGRLQL